MKTRSAAVQAYLAQRVGIEEHGLFWVKAKDRATGNPSPIGVWSGGRDVTFTLDGEVRTYHGAGPVLKLPEIVSEVGLKDRRTKLSLSPLSDEVKSMLNDRDVRNCRLEIHTGYIVHGGSAFVDVPDREYRGFIADVVVKTPSKGGAATADFDLRSASMVLRRPLALKKSSESLKLRAPLDEFRQYTDVTGVTESVWGEERG